MNIIAQKFRKLFSFFGKIFRSIKLFYYKNAGISVGKNTMISFGAKIDTQRGKITIGDNTTITWGTVILSHDYASHLLKSSDKRIRDRTLIGNNVFIGVNSVVMNGVKIGNNSIIGAGSVVTKDIPDNVVAFGNPIKIVNHRQKLK